MSLHNVIPFFKLTIVELNIHSCEIYIHKTSPICLPSPLVLKVEKFSLVYTRWNAIPVSYTGTLAGNDV